MKYKSVGVFSNDTNEDITIFLELHCEEIRVSPHQSFELFIEETTGGLPVSINYVHGGIQIYPNLGSPEWLILFKGQKIKPDYPTVLKDYE